MAKKYIIKTSGRSIELSKPNSTSLVYKFAYRDVEAKKNCGMIQNKFIVYILTGRDDNGRDIIYVGKSKNGIDYRPTAHKDKFSNWSTCYVLTQFIERSFFNDGTIQYLEDQICSRVNEIGKYVNTTISTTSGTANKEDEEDCEEYLIEAYQMLNILGLDLITNSEEDLANNDISDNITDVEARSRIPNGVYTFARKVKRLNDKLLQGSMEVSNGQFILKAGSDIAPNVGIGLVQGLEELRDSISIEDGVLKEDVVLNSPSACGELILGSACNGWLYWKNTEGKPIDIYRK